MNAATDEIYQRLRKQLDDALNADKRLAYIAEKIKRKQATLADTAEYSEIVANHIAAVLQAAVGDIRSPLGKELVCRELLRDHYAAINDVLGTVQAIVDEQREIHIRPQQAAFPAERVQKVAHALEDPTVSLDIIRRRANAPVANVAKSFHDDYIKENAKFRADAGLKCWIVRTTDGKCCKWCTQVAGRYEYGTEPSDVYRRHDNCGCTTIYENGRQRQDVWSKKKWEVPAADAGAKKPTILTPAQGRALQAKHKPTVLTKGSRSGIIKSITVADIKVADVDGIIAADCARTIADTIAEYQKEGHKFKFDAVEIVSIPMKDGKFEVLRTNAVDRYGYPRIVLEINQVVFGGRTKDDIDAIFSGTNYTVCESLREAVIHEIGHAKVINGRTYANYERIAEELSVFHNHSVSELGSVDGLELLAECEVLLGQGKTLPEDIADMYNTYTTGGG